MLKIVFILLGAAVLIGGGIGGWHLWRVSARNKKEMALYTGPAETYQANLGKTLVIYYSWTGRTRDIAQRIAQLTQADVYEIETQKPFSKMPWVYLQIKKQIKNGQYPALKTKPLDLAAYDTVFLGSPIWWYTASTPVFSFLQETDFMGKPLVLFSTQGSNYGTFFKDIKAKAQNAQFLPGGAFNNMDSSYDAAVNNKIINWLNGLHSNTQKEVLVGEQFH